MKRHSNTQPPRRRVAAALATAALAVTGLAALTATPAAADGGIGTAVGTSSRTDNGHAVMGSGTFALAGGNNDAINVAFECTSNPSPTTASVPTGAGIHPPAYNGCILVRNGTTFAVANGLGIPGPAATTGAVVAMPWLGTTSLQVCWHTYIIFLDGYNVSTSGCTSISIMDNIPNVPPPSTDTSENKDPYGFIWAIGTQGQDEGHRLICVSIGGNTHNCGVGVTTSGSSYTNGVSVSGSGPANSTCTLGNTSGCTIGAVAVSGTGTAGTANCDYALLAVSATGDTCGTVAISGTGTTSGDYEISGKETACTHLQLMC